MNRWTTRFRSGHQAQHLDDLEDILNSPSPALGQAAADVDLSETDTDSVTQQGSGPQVIPASTAKAQQDQSAALYGTPAQSSHQSSQEHVLDKVTSQPNQAGQLSVWTTAYKSASAPVAAVFARIPEHLQRLRPQLESESAVTGQQQTTRLPFLLEHMARHKGATAAATIAGAAAGGAIAGPFGIAAGAKSGAVMVALGAAAAGAAQHYYMPVAPSQHAASCTQPSQSEETL